jgi:FKBP-type peptidyl-prolyl cis-trans isomerase
VTASGLASRMLKAGSGGAKPKATDRVTVNYSGWTTDGTARAPTRRDGPVEPA